MEFSNHENIELPDDKPSCGLRAATFPSFTETESVNDRLRHGREKVSPVFWASKLLETDFNWAPQVDSTRPPHTDSGRTPLLRRLPAGFLGRILAGLTGEIIAAREGGF